MNKRKMIDVEKAIYLSKKGLHHREIGRMLADECGRSTPFLEGSVSHAVNRHHNLRLKSP